ncbi:hypothetical protein HMPREF1582_00494 [Gardnerella vaginalis JCP8151A]|nr:hypothetical protein HMPREF1582_00494 [Gardnerella vaginalis JCP8151A]
MFGLFSSRISSMFTYASPMPTRVGGLDSKQLARVGYLDTSYRYKL